MDAFGSDWGMSESVLDNAALAVSAVWAKHDCRDVFGPSRGNCAGHALALATREPGQSLLRPSSVLRHPLRRSSN